MKCDQILEIDRGYLRIVEPADVHLGYVNGLNDPEVNRYLDSVSRTHQTTEGVTAFVSHNLTSTSDYFWGIWLDGGDCFCGTVRVHGIDSYHRVAHIGICIFDRNTWGRKIGVSAIAAVTDWALNVLGLRWVEAGAFESNVASQKAFVAAGYEWVFDIPGKFLLHGKPEVVKVYAARNKALLQD